MANDLTTTDPAAGHRDLAWLARNPRHWTIEAARETAGPDARAAIAAAVVRIQDELAPVPADPALRAQWDTAMDERLRRLGVKIAPGMSVEQAAEWRAVMVDALSNLPAMVGLSAAKRALHRPMRFLNEAEATVRDIAAGLIEWRRVALNKLDDFRRSLDATSPPALPPPDDRPLTHAEIRALDPSFLRIGLSQGWLTQADVDAAHAEVHDQAA